MQRVRIRYTKEEPIKFISHRDLIRVFERALRRTDISMAYSQGFNPRQRISFGPPLKLGLTSENEYLDLYLETETNPETVKEKLNSVLPLGINILEAQVVDLKGPSLFQMLSEKSS